MECNIYNRNDYGGFWRRFFADSIDGIILGMLFSVVSVSAIPEDISDLLVLLTFLAYMIGFKVYTGGTPGYQILQMKIIAINGAEVTVKQLSIRLFSSLFSSMAFGLGFIWIAFDKNRQAWHDKIAGTYIVRTEATPVRTVMIPQTSLFRKKLFALVVLAPFALFTVFFGGIMIMMQLKTSPNIYELSKPEISDTYLMAEQYTRENLWIQEEVGEIIKISRFSFEQYSDSLHVGVMVGASYLIGSGGHMTNINVFGEKGKIVATVMMKKIENQWIITMAGYNDKDGNKIDITIPYDKNIRRADVAAGTKLFLTGAVKAERDALLHDINKMASAAASYWRKPVALGGGARSFAGVTDVTSFGTDSSNENGTFAISAVTENQFTLTATGSNEGVIVVATITQNGFPGASTITHPLEKTVQ